MKETLESAIDELAYKDGFEIWDSLTFEELKVRVSRLPVGDAVLFTPVSRDADGVSIIPYDLAKQLSAVSPVPIFVHHDSLLGSGVVGGYVFSGYMVGKIIGELMLRPLSETAASQEPNEKQFRYVFDDTALERYGISRKRIPRESVLINHTPSFWELYTWQILIIALFLCGETTIIIFLVRAIRLKNSAVNDLRSTQNLLELKVKERTSELAEVNRELAEMAMTDKLTGIANRRRLENQVKIEIKRSRRFGFDFGFILFDIDHFKSINDQYGHESGDAAIKAVAGIGTAALREIDLIARMGGDEFVMVIPRAAKEETFNIAERFRREIVAHRIQSAGGETFGITVSLGITVFEHVHATDDFQSIYKRADRALYAAKENGRNQISVFL